MKQLSIVLIILLALALFLGSISCGKSEPRTIPETPTENGTPSPDTTPPSIANVSISDITETSATIFWTTDEPATSQVEYGETISYGATTPLDENLVTNHSVALSGLTPGTTYHFRVKSKDSSGNEATSGDYTFTMPDTIAPTISEVIASDITESSAKINWTTDEPATTQVEYGTTSAYGLSSSLDTNLVTSHSVSLSELESDTTYHFRVRSKDANGNEAVAEDNAFTTAQPTLDTLTVHFIDVGQGDSILIDLGSIEVLIDGGGKTPGVVGYLNDYVDGPLEIMIATHPHADHIGGLIAVLGAFEVEEIWHNGDISTSQTYADFMAAVDAEGAEIHVARRGDEIEAGGLTFTVLNPAMLAGTTNNNSIVLSLSYGEVDFLFTGDAEQEAEADMVGAGIVPNVEILKVGHHGSKTASSQSFLAVAQPETAIYMAGEGNSYGHPHAETISSLQTIGASIYGTDVNGTILVTTDGATYTVQTEREGETDGEEHLTSQYENPEYGYKIEYPQDWELDEVSAKMVLISMEADTIFGFVTIHTSHFVIPINEMADAFADYLADVTSDEWEDFEVAYSYSLSGKWDWVLGFTYTDILGSEPVDGHGEAYIVQTLEYTFVVQWDSEESQVETCKQIVDSFTLPPLPDGASNVQITRIFYDGVVYRVESDEYVEITNLGNAPQDLQGWVLKDISEGYPSFTFPSYTLAPGASIRVYTNEIHPEWGGFSFGYGKAIWNNTSPDTAALYNAQGQEVSRKSY